MGAEKTGRLIARKRKELGLSREQLADKAFVTPQAVSLWETGQRYPSPAAQIMLYKVLGLNAVELLVGLEMYDDDLKKGIAAFMGRMDEKVPQSGMVTDEDGNEFFLDWSEYEIVMPDRDEAPAGKWVPWNDFYNLPESKIERSTEEKGEAKGEK